MRPRKLAAAFALLLFISGCAKSEQQKCMDDFNRAIGHSTSDDAFWEHLQSCARKNLLPPGKNDPGYYE
jgi:hypothetical protein